MKNRIILILFMTFGLIIPFSPAKHANPKTPFDGQAAWTYIRDMSSDTMEGRKSGTPGGDRAAQYVASKFREWGLEPAGLKGSWFQDYGLEFSDVAPGVYLEIIAGESKREFIYGEDWRADKFSGAANAVADLIYVGYGISAPQQGYDDYAGLDIKGKFVAFSTETPRIFDESLKDRALLDNRILAARSHGAMGAFLFGPQPRGFMGMTAAVMMRGDLSGIKKENYDKSFPIITIEARVVSFLFKDVGTDLAYLQQQVAVSRKPQRCDISAHAYLRLKSVFDENRAAQNVLARITGSDPELKNEYIIVGGHMDHLGLDPFYKEAFRGANDNASGTAVVMEMARVMKASGAHPKRTIIFAAWSGEEQGLLGSKYYAENPVYPLDKTVAYLNLDMVSHGDGKIDFPGIYYAPDIWNLLKSKLPKDILESLVPSRGGPGGSDQSYFLYKGIPAFAIMTSGYHFKYHKTGDKADLAQPAILKKTGDLVSGCLEILANEPSPLILPQRQEIFWWKYLTLINYVPSPLQKVLKDHKDTKEPDIDWQLIGVPQKEGLFGDPLRIQTIRDIFAGQDDVRSASTFMLYGDPGTLDQGGRSMSRSPGKTIVVQGLLGIDAFKDEPRWADVYAKQGVAFVAINGPSGLFAENGLTEEGRKIIGRLAGAGLILTAKGLDNTQAKSLLKAYEKPLFLISRELPDRETLDLITKYNGALGLIFGKDEGGADYFRRLVDAKKEAGTEILAVVNENCLWSQAAKDQYLHLIGELLKAKWANRELALLFFGNFLKVLNSPRADASGTAGATRFMMF